MGGPMGGGPMGGGPMGGPPGGDPRFYASRDGGGGDEGGGRGRGSDSSKSSGGKSYRFKSAAERLPEGLPDWFARSDSNVDGQVAMAEFSTSWSDSVIADFNKFDLDGDGIITPRECLKANEQGAVRGISVAPAGPQPGAGAPAQPAAVMGGVPAPSAAVSGEAKPPSAVTPAASPDLAGLDPKYVKYSMGQIRKYDRNSDGMLSEAEWKSMSSDPSAADADGNKVITVEELTKWYSKR